MDALHSMLENVTTAGSLYGWRADAMAFSALLTLMVTAYGHLPRSAHLRLVAARA